MRKPGFGKLRFSLGSSRSTKSVSVLIPGVCAAKNAGSCRRWPGEGLWLSPAPDIAVAARSVKLSGDLVRTAGTNRGEEVPFGVSLNTYRSLIDVQLSLS